MSKKVLLLAPHSFVDVITNSSTELFVCNTDKSVELVRIMLQDIVDVYSLENGGNYCFSDIFEEPYIFTKEKLKDSGGYWGYETEENIGKIIIQGIGDNSIPYDLFDKIECVFKTERYHLG